MSRFPVLSAGLFVVALVVVAGCDSGPTVPAGRSTGTAGKPSAEGGADEIAAERAKLDPEDRSMVQAQEWCVVSSDERLGSMGPPIKLDIKGQPVFICCKGCRKKAEADPDKTLAKVEELKAKAKAEKAAKN